MEDISKPLFFCVCNYYNSNVGSGAMETIIGRLKIVWKEKWAVLLVFCVELAKFENEWDHIQGRINCSYRLGVGCVKINCRSGRDD